MVKRAKQQSRRMAALLAIVVVGMFGAHKFYIGNMKAGVIQLIALFVASGLSNMVGVDLPISLAGVFACVEGTIYALKSDEEFDEQYVCGGKAFL